MDYYQKYLKYKNKYLELKKIVGSGNYNKEQQKIDNDLDRIEKKLQKNVLSLENNDLSFINELYTKDIRKETILILAIEYNKINLIEKLLKLRDIHTIIDGSIEYPKIPLFEALYYNNLKIVELLLKYGANVNIKNRDGKTPLIYAIEFFKDKKIIQLLLKKGADINLKDNDGKTAKDYNIEKMLTTKELEKQNK